MSLSRAAVVLLVASSSLVIANGNHEFHRSASFGSNYQKSYSGDQTFGASQSQPVISTKTTYNGCSSATGCGGVTLENGKVVHKYGNPAAIGIDGAVAPESLDPTDIHLKFAGQASDVNSAFGAGLPANGPFWWATPNSPFKNAHEAYMKWIKDGFSGVSLGTPCGVCAANNKVHSEGSVSNSIDISNNPFLNGQFAAGFSQQQPAGFTPPKNTFQSSGNKEVDISNNPFLNGNIKMPPFPGQQSTSFQSSFESSQTPGQINFANNPFLNGGVTSGGCSGPPGSGCGASAVLHQTGSVSAQEFHSQTAGSTPSGCGPAGCGSQGGIIHQSGSVGTNDYNQQSVTPGGCGPAGCGSQGVIHQSGFVSTNEYNKQSSTPGGCGPAGCGSQGVIHQSGSVSTNDYNKQSSTPSGCGPAGCGSQGVIHQSGSVSTNDYNKQSSTPGGCGPAGCGSQGIIHQSGSVSTNEYNKQSSTPSGCGPAGCGSQGIIHQSGSVSTNDYNKQSTAPNCGPGGCRTPGLIHQSGSVNTQDFGKPTGGSAPTGCGGPGGSCDYQGQQQTTYDFDQQTTCTGPFCGDQQQTQSPFPTQPANKPPFNVPHPQGATNGNFRGENKNPAGELTVSCNGQDRVCVQKYLCVNGLVNDNGENILQFRGATQCKTSTETCCKLKPKNPNYSVGGNLVDSTSLQSSVSNSVVSGSTSGITFIPGSDSQVTDQSFFTRPGNGAVLKPGIPYLPPREPEPTTRPPYTPPPYVPPKPTPPRQVQPKPATERPTTRPPPITTPYKPPVTQPPTRPTPARTPPPYVPPKTNPPPYLPPKEDERPQPSTGSQQIVPGPQKPDTEGSLLLDNTRNPPPKNFEPVIPSACAAALKCTPIELCTAEGVISNTTVILTKEQQQFRVPLTDCKDVDSGLVGKCCRDPTYTDPWPTNQLGQWVPGAFGDTGAYRAGGKNNGKPPSTSGNGFVAGAKPADTINRPIFTNPGPRPNFSNTKNPPKTSNNNFIPKPPPRVNNNQPPKVPDSFTSGQLQLSNYSPGQCGVRRPGRPSGNKANLEVDFGEIPWQAMVLLETNRSLLCGGVITAPDAVVTSAHCVDGLDARNVMIKGGEWKLGIDEEPKPFQIVRVANIVKHPAYQPGNLQYDLAILMLEENLRFAEHINPICLPQVGQPEVYNKRTQCITTGWGKQVLQVNIPNSIMHSVDMNILPPQQCQGQISQNYPHLLEQYNPNNCICGQPLQGNVCKVDIGSALACTGPDGSYYMEGVYSWDSGCSSPVQVASFFKFDASWYENAMESSTSQTQQRFETVQNNQVYKRQYETAQIAQPTQIHTYTVAGNGIPGQSYALSGREAFNQAVGHVHTGPDCHCTPNGK